MKLKELRALPVGELVRFKTPHEVAKWRIVHFMGMHGTHALVRYATAGGHVVLEMRHTRLHPLF